MEKRFSKWVKWTRLWDTKNNRWNPKRSRWTHEKIKELENIRSPGIYALAISKKNINGNDFEFIKCIAYFGTTNSLKRRLSQFNNTLRGKKGHSGAVRFMHDYRNGKDLARLLYVSVRPFKCEAGEITEKNLRMLGCVVKAEYEAWAEYVKRFKKLPKYNNRK